tara:strand:+ start:458 stop:580 length:123 start_codon:yes stop_codon:yes gene_type:complete
MQTSLLKKEKIKRIERSLKINLKKRKIFQNKIKKKIIISK